jgi:hydroxypyruvate isomerase
MNNNTIKDGLKTYQGNLLVGAKKTYAKKGIKALKACGFDLATVVWPTPDESEAKWAEGVQARMAQIVTNRSAARAEKKTLNPAQQRRREIKGQQSEAPARKSYALTAEGNALVRTLCAQQRVSVQSKEGKQVRHAVVNTGAFSK